MKFGKNGRPALIKICLLLLSLNFSLSACGLGSVIEQIIEFEERTTRSTTKATYQITYETFSSETSLSNRTHRGNLGVASSTSSTTTTTTVATTHPTTVPTTVVKNSLQLAFEASEQYFTGARLSEALNYFNEIAANSEFKGVKPITKWKKDIRIKLHGDYNDADLAVLNDLIDYCSAIEGMPGISLVDAEANVDIYFVPSKSMKDYIRDYVDGNLGFFEVYWNGAYEIYSGTIAISTDRTGPLDRQHLLWEELVQSLGLLNDSYTYQDSIFQQDYSVVQHPSALDFAILRMLYAPAVVAGDSGAHAVDALRAVYGG